MPPKLTTRANALLDEQGPITLAQLQQVIDNQDRLNQERHEQVLASLNSKIVALDARVVSLESSLSAKDKHIKQLVANNKSQAELINSIDRRLLALKNLQQYDFVQMQEGRQCD